jgi:hypothetical protein
LQLIIFAYHGDFQNKVHHILGILRFKFTIPLLFGFFFFACINSDYYITNNNTFNEIVISNQFKLYITCVCSHVYVLLLKNIFFKQNHYFIFFKPYLVCTTLILIDSNIVKIQPFNTKTTKVIINAQKIHDTKNTQKNISQNINHRLSTSKNNNKNLQPSRIKTKTFNLQVF